MVLVKICGVRSPVDAQMALDAGANMIGIILVPNRGRTVSLETAKAIAKVVHEYRGGRANNEVPHSVPSSSGNFFANNSKEIEALAMNPLLVGVFMNQSLEEIQHMQREIKLDLVQLHGSEAIELCKEIEGPVIKRFTPGGEQYKHWGDEGYHTAILIDGETGGNGELVNWDLLNDISKTGAKFILGGGITPENVQSAVSVTGVFMVDVSSGVEDQEGTNKGFKNKRKVQEFIRKAQFGAIKQ